MPATVGNRRNWAMTLLFAVFGGPGIMLVYVPAAITRWRLQPESRPVRALASVCMLAGAVTLLTCMVQFVVEGRGTALPTHPTKFLVRGGLYRHVRNPMYLGALCTLIGEALLFGSGWLWIYTAVAAAVVHAFVRLYEEPMLERTYGPSFREYCAHVPRWIPRLRG